MMLPFLFCSFVILLFVALESSLYFIF